VVLGIEIRGVASGHCWFAVDKDGTDRLGNAPLSANVALDRAREWLRGLDELQITDVADQQVSIRSAPGAQGRRQVLERDGLPGPPCGDERKVEAFGDELRRLAGRRWSGAEQQPCTGEQREA
jgi:hypothetical protein